MKIELKSNILLVRDLEDTIRATRKYTKGAFSKASKHPQKIQGEQFPSRVLTEYYEVYPDLEIGWDMRAGDAWAWVWGDVIHIDITFLYDYRDNKAKVTIHGGKDALENLKEGIPGFKSKLSEIEKVNKAQISNRDTAAKNISQKQLSAYTGGGNKMHITLKRITLQPTKSSYQRGDTTY